MLAGHADDTRVIEMTLPRASLVRPEATPYYHVISRCVRQQFLCGFDTRTSRDFTHRREWIRARMRQAARAFAINIHAYAIMSNHFHLVVELQPHQVLQWSDTEVIRRWRMAFKGPALLDRFTRGAKLSTGERARIKMLIPLYRERLGSLSWFMRAINEPIARMANQEDNVAGRFWDGRFKSQALLTAGALIAAMAYVDLNPIRAGLASTPEGADYTSIQERIRGRRGAGEPLEPLGDGLGGPGNRLCGLDDYLELVDWSGRFVQKDKVGVISRTLPPLLVRLGLQPDGYTRLISRTERRFKNWIGPSHAMQHIAGLLGRRFLQGQGAAETVFQVPQSA